MGGPLVGHWLATDGPWVGCRWATGGPRVGHGWATTGQQVGSGRAMGNQKLQLIFPEVWLINGKVMKFGPIGG